MDIKEVADKIYRIFTPVAGIRTVFTVYIIKTKEAVLLEPGPASAVPQILEGMKQLGITALSYIIPTHIHIDHAGGVGKLAQLFPQAKVVLHPQGVKHIVDPSRLIQSTKMAFGDDYESLYGAILPVAESQVLVPQDGEIISVEDRNLQVIYAPGHAPHHMAIFDQKISGLFCGEALGLPRAGAESFPIPAAAPPSFDRETYLGMMGKLEALHPRLLFYSHDGEGREPDNLIAHAAENTRVFGDIILKYLKKGESPEAIERRLEEHAFASFGLKPEVADLSMTVNGFILYFKKNGLA